MKKYIRVEDIISELESYYTEYGEGRPLEYSYGFFDALAVVRAHLRLSNKSGT